MLHFYLTEVLKSFSRARLSSFISLVTTTISILLVTLSVLLFLWSSQLVENFNKKTVLTVFLKDSQDETGISSLASELKNRPYTNTIRLINKEDAKKEFLRQTGEDFSEVLDYNPLPASVELRLKGSYVQQDSLRRIIRELSRMGSVDEVVFESGVIYKALDLLASLRLYVLIASVVLIMISLYLVYSTNRLIIHSNWRQIETMKLVGAKLSSIKIPILFNGILVGLISSLMTFLILNIFQLLIGENIVYATRSMVFTVNLAVFISGPLVGFSGSMMASRKVSLKINKLLL